MMKTDRLVFYLISASVTLMALLTAACYLLATPAAAISALAGGMVAIVNLLWQQRALGALLNLPPSDRPALSAVVRFTIRISLTALVLYLIVTSRWFSVWGLLAGLSVTVLCLFGLTIYVAIQTKENES